MEDFTVMSAMTETKESGIYERINKYVYPQTVLIEDYDCRREKRSYW